MFSGCNPYTDFVVTKAVGNSGGLQPEVFTNEKGVRKAKVGDYTIKYFVYLLRFRKNATKRSKS